VLPGSAYIVLAVSAAQWLQIGMITATKAAETEVYGQNAPARTSSSLARSVIIDDRLHCRHLIRYVTSNKVPVPTVPLALARPPGTSRLAARRRRRMKSGNQ